MTRLASSSRVTLTRPGAFKGVTLDWWEWRDLTALARLYGWRGVPDADRMSSAEASDLVKALERAPMSPQLRDVTENLLPIAREGGIDVMRER